MKGMSAPAMLLADAMPLCYQAFHAIPPLSNPEGKPSNAVIGVLNAALRFVREEQPAAVAFVFDPKTPTHRHLAFPAYKAQRKPMPDDLSAQSDRIAEGLRALGFSAFDVPGFEADDAIATLAVRFAGPFDVRVLSPDKDLLQLVRPGVIVVNPRTGARTDTDALRATWGLSPSQIPDYLALVGDASDNLPGVLGVGPKTAHAWLEAHGDLEGILRAAETLAPARARDALRASADQARKVRALAVLREDAPVDSTPESLAPRNPRSAAARAFLEREGLRTLLDRLFGKGPPPSRGLFDPPR